jgi:hypothetical protein
VKVAFALGAVLALPGAASGSIWVADNAQRPALQVDARGYAEVSWTAGGARHTLLVPPRGRLLPGARLSGSDVSRALELKLPLARAVRRTPDGRRWALQAWRPRQGGPVELHFSRWRGSPTALTLETGCCRFESEFLHGRASFQGRPVFGTSPTPEGKRLRAYAYIECFACPASPRGWGQIVGVSPRRDGTFSARLRLAWRAKRYRATIAGPNRGTTLAPDMRAFASVGPLPA